MVELDIYETTGGGFDTAGDAQSVIVGTMIIEFVDCNNATVTYQIEDGRLEGSIPITRVIPGSDDFCSQFSEL